MLGNAETLETDDQQQPGKRNDEDDRTNAEGMRGHT